MLSSSAMTTPDRCDNQNVLHIRRCRLEWLQRLTRTGCRRGREEQSKQVVDTKITNRESCQHVIHVTGKSRTFHQIFNSSFFRSYLLLFHRRWCVLSLSEVHANLSATYRPHKRLSSPLGLFFLSWTEFSSSASSLKQWV